MLEYFKAKLHFVIVLNPGLTYRQRELKLAEIEKLIKENNLNASIDSIVEDDILRGILKKTRSADLIIMGGRSGDFLELLLAKSLVQEITERVKCPVLWVKEYEEKESFLLSLLKPYKVEMEA